MHFIGLSQGLAELLNNKKQNLYNDCQNTFKQLVVLKF